MPTRWPALLVWAAGPLRNAMRQRSEHHRIRGDLDRGIRWARAVVRLDEALYGPEHIETVPDMAGLGAFLEALEAFDKGEAILRRALSIAEAAQGPDGPYVGRVLVNLAGLMRARGEMDEALSHCERALGVFAHNYQSNHPDVVIAMNNLGTVLTQMGDPARARDHYRRAIRNAEALYGPDDPSIAPLYHSLASTLRVTGDMGGALEALHRRVEILEANADDFDEAVAGATRDFGAFLHDIGYLDGAREMVGSALSMYDSLYERDVEAAEVWYRHIVTEIQKLIGRISPRYDAQRRRWWRENPPMTSYRGAASCYANYGLVMRDLDDLEQAHWYIKTAIWMYGALAGFDEEEPIRAPEDAWEAEVIEIMAQNLFELGRIERRMGDLVEARAHMQQSLRATEYVLGPEHTSMANVLVQLGGIAEDLGYVDPDCYVESSAHFRRALAISEAAYGPESDDLIGRVWDLGRVLWIMGARDEALTLYERGLRLLAVSEQLDRSPIVSMAQYLHAILANQRDPDGRMATCQAMIEIAEALRGPHHPLVAVGTNELGCTLNEMEKWSQAHEPLAKAVRLMDEGGENHGTLYAAYLADWGLALHYVERCAEAREAYERAIALVAAADGPKHPAIVDYNMRLRNIAIEMDDLPAAIEYAERALRLQESSLPPSDLSVVRCTLALSDAQWQGGRRDDAKETLNGAMRLLSESAGPNHQYMAVYAEQLGEYCQQTGDLVAARDYYQSALDVTENDVGPDHPAVADRAVKLARVLAEIGNHDAAEKRFAQARKIAEANEEQA